MLFDLLRRGWYFDKDGGAGGSPASDTTTDDGAGGEDAEKAGKPKVAPGTFTPEQQSAVDALVGDARKKEREHYKAELDREAAKAKKKAEEDSLKEKEEWKTLADKRQAELDQLAKEKTELEPFKAQAERYRAALDAQLTKVKERLPKYLLPLIEKMDPVEAMDYITEHAEEIGAGPETYGETPKHKEKRVSDDDKRKSQETVSNVITRIF